MTRFEKDGWQQWKPSTSVKTKIWLRLDFFKNSQTYLIPLDCSYPRICLWCHHRYFTQFSIPLYLTWKQRFLNFFPRRSLAQCRIIACDLISAKLWLSHRWQVDYKSEDPTSVLKNSSSWVNCKSLETVFFSFCSFPTCNKLLWNIFEASAGILKTARHVGQHTGSTAWPQPRTQASSRYPSYQCRLGTECVLGEFFRQAWQVKSGNDWLYLASSLG